MQTNKTKQWDISMKEVAAGIGTKTDLGKDELHLMCTRVYIDLYGEKDYTSTLTAIPDIMREYVKIIRLIQDREENHLIYMAVLNLKLELASIYHKGTEYIDMINMVLQNEIKVLMYGKYKYSADNWRKIDPPLRYFDAFGRHLLHMMKDGMEAVDEESGLPSMSHCHCDLSFFAELLWTRGPYDNYDVWVAREKAAETTI